MTPKIRRLELALAAAQSAVDILAQCGPSNRFPEAEHLAAVDRARRARDAARARYGEATGQQAQGSLL